MFMAQCYAPEEVSAAVLIAELATDLVSRGHEVTVVTGAPSYPSGRVSRGYRNVVYQSEWLEGVRVIRTWSYISPRKTFWRRFFHYGTYSATAFYGGLFAGRPDIIVSFSPPLPLGLSAWGLSQIWHVPWVLQLEDLFPEAAVAAGVMRNQTAIAFFSEMECFQYRRAMHISLISEAFRQNVIRKGIPPEKITLIPVWADPDVVRPFPKENSFKIQHGLAGKFIVMYAGNLGLTSCLEDVLDAAEQLLQHPEICFVLVGEGVKKAALESRSHAKGLKNVIFLPYQPRAVFPEMMAAADLSLVTINQDSCMFSLPSKVFNVMASMRPILAIAPAESEIALLIEESKGGILLPPNQPTQLAEVILRMKRDEVRLAEMGRKGRAYLENEFSRSRCVDMYEEMLRGLCPE